MGGVRNYSTNTIMEKTNRRKGEGKGSGRGPGVKDMEFSGVLKK